MLLGDPPQNPFSTASVRLGHSASPVCRKADTAKRFTSTRPNKRDCSSLAVGRRRSLARSVSTDLKKRGQGPDQFSGASHKIAARLQQKYRICKNHIGKHINNFNTTS